MLKKGNEKGLEWFDKNRRKACFRQDPWIHFRGQLLSVPALPRVTGQESAFFVAHSPFSRTGMCLRIQSFCFWEDADVLLVLSPTKDA